MAVMTPLMMFQMKIMKIMILMIMPVMMFQMKIMTPKVKLKIMIRMIPLMNIEKKRKKMMSMEQEKMKVAAEQLQ